MVLLSAHGLAPAQIAELLDCHPATVRGGSAGSTTKAQLGWLIGPGAGGPGGVAAS
jgi:hypothetical protein